MLLPTPCRHIRLTLLHERRPEKNHQRILSAAFDKGWQVVSQKIGGRSATFNFGGAVCGGRFGAVLTQPESN